MDEKREILKDTHTPVLTALCPGLPRWAGTRKVKPIWILLEQETVSGNDISWAICKSTHRSRQMTMPAPHHSVFYRPDALPVAQPTVSKHWRGDRSYYAVYHNTRVTGAMVNCIMEIWKTALCACYFNVPNVFTWKLWRNDTTKSYCCVWHATEHCTVQYDLLQMTHILNSTFFALLLDFRL